MFRETRSLDSMPWRIFRDDMRIVDEDQVKSIVSTHPTFNEDVFSETKLSWKSIKCKRKNLKIKI